MKQILGFFCSFCGMKRKMDLSGCPLFFGLRVLRLGFLGRGTQGWV